MHVCINHHLKILPFYGGKDLVPPFVILTDANSGQNAAGKAVKKPTGHQDARVPAGETRQPRRLKLPANCQEHGST